MTGCPLAYSDPCSSCAKYGECAPSQAVRKIEELEKQIKEIKQLLEIIIGMQYNERLASSTGCHAGKASAQA